jgi:hypothetical protein
LYNIGKYLNKQQQREVSVSENNDDNDDNGTSPQHLNQATLQSSTEDSVHLMENSEEGNEEIVDNRNEDENNLPPNWIRRSDDTGDVWFENLVTKELRWQVPHMDDQNLNNVWLQRSDETGDIWYENAVDSDLVEWELPEGGRIIEDDES